MKSSHWRGCDMSLCCWKVCARLNTCISDYTCTQTVLYKNKWFFWGRGGWLRSFSLLPCLRFKTRLTDQWVRLKSDSISLICLIRFTEQSINQFINQSVSLSVNISFPSYLETDSNNKVFCDVRVFKAEATFRQLRSQNPMLWKDKTHTKLVLQFL